MSEEKAQQLAEMLGGTYFNSGGGVYVVVMTRADGKVVSFTEEVVCLFPNIESVGDESALIDHIDLV